MADNAQQAAARRQLAARGNQLAPRVDSSGNATSTLERRQERATRRRAVVVGAVEGSEAGPAGAAAGAVKSRSAAKKQERKTRAARGGPRGKNLSLGKMQGPHTAALFAEYFGGALVISLELFTQGATKGYPASIARVMMRLTALTAVFFVLFLMQGSRRGSQAAVWLGLLVDLGIIFTAARGQTFSTTADIISGQGTGIQLTSAGDISGTGGGTGLQAPAQPQGVQLPDE